MSLSLLLAPAGATAASSRRIGTRPSLPSGATAVGSLPQTTQLSVTVTLQPRDPAALAAYAAAVSTPGSSVYHHYVSVAQFAQRFGPTASQVAQAEASIRAQGLTPGQPAPDGLSFQVTADAGRLASAFNTHFERYRLRSGRTAYVNTSAPLVTGSGAPVVQSVMGLNNLAVEKPQGLLRARGKTTAPRVSVPHAVSASALSDCPSADSLNNYGSYTAQQIAGAYGLGGLYGAGDQGAGVTVALYELEPYNSSDITAYETCYGVSTPVNQPAVLNGGKASCGIPADPNCGLEDVLDIEDVIGLAPDASISVYAGANTADGAYNTYKQIVTDDKAQVISTSWGECESEQGSSAAAAENTLFQEAAAQGQSVLAAAGDSGTQDCTDSSGSPTGNQAVDDPASQPYVTGVGGTSLTSTSGPLESVWNDGTSGGAGGGGVSTLWPAQPYQSGFAQGQSSVFCGGGGHACREVPDVSADADPNTGYDIYWTPLKGSSPYAGWGPAGGTSAAAPTWAALIALADASAQCHSPVGFANPGLYAAARTAYAADFNDITSGNNGFDGVTGYSAGPGYDMASGLGSPRGPALAASLCGSVGDSVALSSSPHGQVSTAGRAVTPVTLSATSASGATPIRYSASGLPSGLSINASSGAVTGKPVRPGTYSVTLSAVDRDGMIATDSFTWIVNSPSVKLAAVGRKMTRVSSRVRIALHATDSVGAALTYRASHLPPGLSINHRTGVISGKPRRKMTRRVMVRAADGYGGSAQRQFTIVVRSRR